MWKMQDRGEVMGTLFMKDVGVLTYLHTDDGQQF